MINLFRRNALGKNLKMKFTFPFTLVCVHKDRLAARQKHFAWAGRQLFLSVVLLFFFTVSFSQDYKKQYRKAKELFKEGNYSAAMDAFNPLSIYDKNNPYAEYASFYYALSAERLGFATVARNQLANLRKTNPSWSGMAEVNLWLAKLYFDKGDYFVAMQLASELKNSPMQKTVDSLKGEYLFRVTDIETLKMIREENPADSIVDRALALAIGQSENSEMDSNLFQSLLLKYNWVEAEFNKPSPSASVFKDRYRVAALLPFRSSTLEPSPEKKKNQPILDLYQGMRMAVDSLAKLGIAIDLLAYDTDRSPDVTTSLLEKEELKGVDLIVGPLFAEEAKPVQLFSKQNEINLLVNPVSSNSDFLKEAPFSFLYQPSHETIGKKCAELISSKVTNKYSIVYYGESPKDSVLAFNYMKRAHELGIKVVYVEEVRKETSAAILDRLAKATEYDEYKNPLQFKMKKDSIGSIFVASDEPVIYTKVVNSVETRGDSIFVIGGEAWLGENSADFTKLERTNVVFSAPNFASVSAKSVIDFRAKYLARHGVLPSENSKKGYEMLMNIGRAMGKFGTNFQQDLVRGEAIGGILTNGFSLQPNRDNGTITFVTFKSGELVEFK